MSGEKYGTGARSPAAGGEGEGLAQPVDLAIVFVLGVLALARRLVDD